MFTNEEKMMSISNLTLKEMKNLLATLPNDCDDWVVSCCGCTDFWVYLRASERAITIDTDDALADE